VGGDRQTTRAFAAAHYKGGQSVDCSHDSLRGGTPLRSAWYPQRSPTPLLKLSRVKTTGTMLKRLAARGLIELGHRANIVCFPATLRAFVERE
jgi:hypothetical protein